jgi:hypothetical protein
MITELTFNNELVLLIEIVYKGPDIHQNSLIRFLKD